MEHNTYITRSVRINLFKLLFFKESRKVGFGLWLFLTANAFLVKHLIDADRWFLCITLCSGLLGAGTLGDKYLEIKKAEKGIPQP